MIHHTLFVCVLCQAKKDSLNELNSGQSLFENLSRELATCEWHEAIDLYPVRCMGACDRSCMVAFAAPNKLTFIVGELSPTDSVSDLLQFSGQYVKHCEGKVPYKERPNAVKKGIHAVLPPLPIAPKLNLDCD